VRRAEPERLSGSPPETSIGAAREATDMAQSNLVDIFFEDPVIVGIVVILLALVFFLYLFLRRIATGFKEGLDEAKR
jgi:uncharacterized membrane protein YdbT with pleckstrin-like domain